MIELNYKEFGQGEPIIILHGLFGTLDNWKTIASKLSEDYLVYILDQRNHGKSPHTDEFSYQLMAEDLYAFMDDNWIQQATIIGHSMGGKTAMQFALEYPEMVNQLIVVDIAPQENEPGHETIFDAMLTLEIDKLESRKAADEWLANKIPSIAVRQFLLKNITRKKEGGFRWKMNLPVIYANYQEVLASITGEEPYDGPTLFLNGGQSGYLDEEKKPGIRALFPEAQFETIEEAGHWIHAEAPDEFLSIVRQFLTLNN